MKTLNLATILLTAALVASGCGSSDEADEEGKNLPTSQPAATTVAPTTGSTTVNTGSTTTTTSTTSATGCPQNPSRSYYTYYKTGTGSTGTATTTSNEIVADSKLRVSIEPGTAPNVGVPYYKMGGTVELLRNGVVIASKHFPNPENDQSGYRRGVPVSQKTDPSMLDFSTYVSGSGKYSIRISSIMTDYKCNTFANSGQYCRQIWDSYCYNSMGGPVLNFDYQTQSYKWCCGTLLQQAQTKYCGVGTIEGVTNAQWAAYVRVETDFTTCIAP